MHYVKSGFNVAYAHIFLCLFVLCLNLLLSACSEQCKKHSRSCEGDILMQCTDPDVEGRFHPEDDRRMEPYLDCGSVGTTCVEGDSPDGEHHAGCLHSEEPCPEGVSSVCEGSDLVLCVEDFRIDGWPCANDVPVCQEANSSAQCAVVEGACSPDGIAKCVEFNGASRIVYCQQGVWNGFDDCDEPGCIEYTDDAGQPSAGCLLSEEPCPPRTETMCIDHEIASCTDTGYPIIQPYRTCPCDC